MVKVALLCCKDSNWKEIMPISRRLEAFNYKKSEHERVNVELMTVWCMDGITGCGIVRADRDHPTSRSRPSCRIQNLMDLGRRVDWQWVYTQSPAVRQVPAKSINPSYLAIK